MYQPVFRITPEINSRIAEIERIREVVKKANILPQQEVILRLRAKLDSIYSSTSIEGNRLNKREVEKVLGGELVRASQRMILEAVNLKQAIDWMEKRLSQVKNISQKEILRLHDLLMDGILLKDKMGSYRQGTIYVVDVKRKKDVVRYKGPKPTKVNGLVSELLIWLKKEEKLHPVLSAGILHFEFVSIHPFSDGNGRMTRLLALFYLWLKKYDFRKALALDSYYWQNRKAYYQALGIAKTYEKRRKSDITSWLDFFTQGFLTTAKDLEREITAVSLSRNIKETIRLSQEELLIVDFVKQMGRVDINDVLEIIEVGERTGQRRLKGLVNKKILKRYGKGKRIYYQLTG